MITVHIGCDHQGFDMKQKIISSSKDMFHFVDHGTYSSKRIDYTSFADSVAKSVLEDPDSFGILICGTGIGMSIRANRNKGIRCALCTTIYTVNHARHHNNANILAIGVKSVEDNVVGMVRHFVKTSYSQNEVYDRRNNNLDK